ncbi:MAG: hypothetical protein JWN39_874 [Ilumatobacteraceae bacterium]|nr:hypothetical protein [Ilumatobacteraceae bacterium]
MVADVHLGALFGEVLGGACREVGTLDRASVQAELGCLGRLQGWKDVRHAQLTRRLNSLADSCPSMFPDADVAAAAKTSRRGADRSSKRASTMGEVPDVEAALGAGRVSGEHVDLLGAALARLSPMDRARLAADGARLATVAAGLTPEQFDRFLRGEIARLDSTEGEERLRRQKLANGLRWWTDPLSGMLRLRGEFDPETGLLLAGRIEAAVEALFHSGVPDTCPTGDRRQDHLRALALVALVNGGIATTATTSSATASGDGGPVNDGPFWPADRAEVIIVIDLETMLNGLHEHSLIDNGHDIDLPVETYRRMACEAGIIPVVLDSEGVAMDAGRTARLATRNQRRALRAMYTTCAIPDCSVGVRHCTPHHVQYWTPPHRGPTDLANLLPLCSRHHHSAHEGGWRLHLHTDRSATITYPDGTVQTTGPPGTARAA